MTAKVVLSSNCVISFLSLQVMWRMLEKRPLTRLGMPAFSFANTKHYKWVFYVWFSKLVQNEVKTNRRSKKTEEKTKVVAAVWGTELIQFFAARDIFHQDDLKKRMNRIAATWWNGCFGKLDDHSVHIMYTKPPPYQNGCSPKNCCFNHLCC